MRLLRMSLVIGLAFTAITACDGDDDSATTSTTEPATTTTTSTPEPGTSTTEPAATTTEPAPSTTTGVTDPPTTTEPTPTTTEPPMVDVKVYFLRGERLAIAHRRVAGPAVLRGALTELLEGPTPEEAAAGLATTIPAGTELLDLNLADGLATVDLSEEYDDGGGSLPMMARVSQVVFTATQFGNADAVEFWMEGVPVDYLGGEGIELIGPQARADTERRFHDGILFDLPTPGSEVTSPFTLTGEGDVFEGDFPLVVRRDGTQLGETLIVPAGAWGMWADFEVAVTVDAPPGPIELVAVDEGGCGPPDCPDPVPIVLPLTLTE